MRRADIPNAEEMRQQAARRWSSSYRTDLNSIGKNVAEPP